MDLGEARRPYEMGAAGSFAFPVPPEALWDDVARFDRFEGWWRWLRDLRVDGDGLRGGTVLRGVVVPPVPYRLEVTIELTRCERPHAIDAEVRGSLHGPARLRIARSDGGSRVTVGWRLEMCKPAMRAAAVAAYPLLRWGHDEVVARAVAGYRRHLAADGVSGGP